MSKTESLSGKVLKKIIAAIIAVLVLGGVGIGVYSYTASKSGEDESASAYREYSVSKGNITVGTSESGTVSLERSFVSLPVSAEVEEVYVKVGTAVKEGDKLAKLNIDDVDKLKKEYQSKIDTAKLELESAKLEADQKLAQAKLTYEATLNGSTSAEETYTLSVEKIARDIASTEAELVSLKKQLSETEELKETYPDDYKKLTAYEEQLEKYNDVYDGYSDTYKGYERTLKTYQNDLTAVQTKYDSYMEDIEETYTDIKTAKEAYEKAEEAYKEAAEKLETAKANYTSGYNASDSTATADSTDSLFKTYSSALSTYNTAYTAYTKAQEEYTGMYKSLNITYSNAIDGYEEDIKNKNTQISEYKSMMDAYSDKMSDYNDKLTDYKEKYEDFKSDFTETYGTLDADGIEDKLEQLNTSISDAEFNLKKLNASKDSDTLNAAQELESAQYSGSTAAEVYDNTVESVQISLTQKQDAYDDAVEDYDELVENLGDGVYVYAECAGAVASVDAEAGDTIEANSNFISISDSSELYVSVAVSEDDISSINVGQECSITLSAYENVSFQGEIDTIAVEPSRSSGSVSYAVSVKFEPKENVTVYSGMSADVTFLQKQVSDVLYVSVNAVTYKGDGISTVLVYDADGNAVEKEVKTGFTDGRYVEITEGLSAGERVLAESAVNVK